MSGRFSPLPTGGPRKSGRRPPGTPVSASASATHTPVHTPTAGQTRSSASSRHTSPYPDNNTGIHSIIQTTLEALEGGGFTFTSLLEAVFSSKSTRIKHHTATVLTDQRDRLGLTALDRIWDAWYTNARSDRRTYLKTWIGDRAVEFVEGERGAGQRLKALKLNVGSLTAVAIEEAATMSDSFEHFKIALPLSIRVLDCLAAGDNRSTRQQHGTTESASVSPVHSRSASPFTPVTSRTPSLSTMARSRKRVSGKFAAAEKAVGESLLDSELTVVTDNLSVGGSWLDSELTPGLPEIATLLSEQDMGPRHRDAKRAIVNSLSSLLFCSQKSVNALATAVGITAFTGGITRSLGLLSGLSLSISIESCNAALKSISADCVKEAAEAVWDPDRCCIFLTDNFDWYFRKSNQRLDNRSAQLSAATGMVFILPPTVPPTALHNRPSRANTGAKRASFTLKTHVFREGDQELEDGLRQEIVFAAASMLLDHLPGLKLRKDLPEWKAKLAALRPHVRPIWTADNKVPLSQLRPVRKMACNLGTIAGTGKMVAEVHSQVGMNPNDEGISPEQRARILARLEWETALFAADLGGVANGRANERNAVDEQDIMANQSMVEWETMPWHEDANFDFALLKNHFGDIVHDPVSLAHYIALLKRVRITREKMQYHETRSLFQHVLAALLMNGLGQILFGDQSSYAVIAVWEGTTFESFMDLVKDVVDLYATSSAGERAQEGGDDVKAHAIWMARDFLISRVYKDCVKWADAGRCLRIERLLLPIFWECGSYKYGREILHRISRLEHELAGDEHADFRAAKEASLFFNGSGIPGDAHGLDLELESSHGFEKRWNMAQGSGASFESIRDKTSASVYKIREIASHVAKEAGAPEIKRGSYDMDASYDIDRLVTDMLSHKVLKQHSDRQLKARPKTASSPEVSKIVDLCSEGGDKLCVGGFEKWRKETMQAPGYAGDTADEPVEHIRGGTIYDVDASGMPFDWAWEEAWEEADGM